MMPTKCSIILIEQSTTSKGNFALEKTIGSALFHGKEPDGTPSSSKESLKTDKLTKLQRAKTLMENLPHLPTAMIIVDDNPPHDLPPVTVPVVIFPVNYRLVHYRCALSDKFTAMTWAQLALSKQSAACHFRGARLRVSYNHLPPYFEKHPFLDSGTLAPRPTFLHGNTEEEYLRSFVSHHNLNVSFEYAGQKWGTLNKTTGIWNGGVGLVRSNKGHAYNIQFLISCFEC